jgi:hypothetical protein
VNVIVSSFSSFGGSIDEIDGINKGESSEENLNKITFNGIHLFPCSLSISLSSFSSDSKTELGNLPSLLPSFISDCSFTYSLSSTDISELNDYSFLYSSLHFSSSSSSSPILIMNKEGPKAEGGNGGGGGGNVALSVMIVLFILALIVIVGGIFFLVWKKKKKKGEKISKEGREMKSSLKEDEKEDEEVKESSSMEKSPSSQSLLSHDVRNMKSKKSRKSENK